MNASYQIEATFHCSVERAFRTPLHGDATKILRGYGPIPPCIGFEEDSTWGKEGGTRIPILKGNWLVKGGRTGLDRINIRKDQEYWQWQVTDFGTWSMFFTRKAVGEWWIVKAESNKVTVRWRYTYEARSAWTRPMNWLFVRLLWSKVMQRGMVHIREMAEGTAPYFYN